MNRVLIVANQTLGGPELQAEIRQRMEAGPCDFWVLVPATNPIHLQLAPQGIDAYANLGESIDDRGFALAEQRLQAELARLKALGAKAAGETGDPDPMQAIRDTMRVKDFDEVIIATLPSGVSRWLRMDLVHKVQRAFRMPVTHVSSREAATSTP